MIIMVVLFSGKALRGFGVGNLFVKTFANATQLALIGHVEHFGLVRVQSVAPKSINPCV